MARRLEGFVNATNKLNEKINEFLAGRAVLDRSVCSNYRTLFGHSRTSFTSMGRTTIT